jgi:hypothetical protein
MSPRGDEWTARSAWHSAIDELRGLGRRRLPDVADLEPRDELADSLFGLITWPKSSGRPDAPDAAAGFLAFSMCLIEKHDTAQGPVYAPIYEPVVMFEEPSDTDHVVVRLATRYHSTTEIPTLLTVQYSTLAWQGPARPRLEPAGGFVVRSGATGPIQAPPFRGYHTDPTYLGDAPVRIG